jgi:hypothetical protein
LGIGCAGERSHECAGREAVFQIGKVCHDMLPNGLNMSRGCERCALRI